MCRRPDRPGAYAKLRLCNTSRGDPVDGTVQWRHMFERVAPLMLNGTVSGLFIGDEITSQGMPFAELEFIVDMVAADLHTLRGRTPQPLIIWVVRVSTRWMLISG